MMAKNQNKSNSSAKAETKS